MIACLCPAIVRSYCWLICDVAATYVRDGQTESARPQARAYKYPVIGSIQHCVQTLGTNPRVIMCLLYGVPVEVHAPRLVAHQWVILSSSFVVLGM